MSVSLLLWFLSGLACFTPSEGKHGSFVSKFPNLDKLRSMVMLSFRWGWENIHFVLHHWRIQLEQSVFCPLWLQHCCNSFKVIFLIQDWKLEKKSSDIFVPNNSGDNNGGSNLGSSGFSSDSNIDEAAAPLIASSRLLSHIGRTQVNSHAVWGFTRSDVRAVYMKKLGYFWCQDWAWVSFCPVPQLSPDDMKKLSSVFARGRRWKIITYGWLEWHIAIHC